MENNYLIHYGIRGQKWGVRRFQNADGTRTAAGKKRYLDQDLGLTRAGKQQFKKANRLDDKNDYIRRNRDDSIAIKKYSEKHNGKIASLLAKHHGKLIEQCDKSIEKNEEKIRKITSDLKSQNVDVVVRYHPYRGEFVYKQSDDQFLDSRDNRAYRKEGIKITRDADRRIVSVKAENADARTIRKVNQIATRGYY